MDEVNATGKLGISLDGSTVYIEKEDLLIEAVQAEAIYRFGLWSNGSIRY